ncbi:MAG: uracil-DNA glycosylase family protein [Candidatus Methanoplasma sp.]|jgi:uracil-DNA glycosylase family 4|nr:uracil-DNA glycosylase family protein [Candidatus Methanoplasma sp.]
MDDLDKLKTELFECRECRDLFGFEPRPVCMGNSGAKIVQVSQAPSIHVHNTGRSFNDISGRRLRNEWYEISEEVFYDPDIFYITSVGHCYPGKSKNKGDNPPPKICAQKWLSREIDMVRNKMFILVGKAAADFFFPKSDFTDLVFSDHTIKGRPAYVIPHPSPLNVRWFKEHPEFEKERIVEIRDTLHDLIFDQYA